MAEEMATTIAQTQVVATTEASDTDSNNQKNKNLSSRFKGLVPQQNGHWGAQLYGDHDRKWLGTFKSEKEATMAYDSAELKIRGGDFHRNYPCDDVTIEERKFQDTLNREEILNMIREGTYQAKFDEFRKNQSWEGENNGEICLGNEGIALDEGRFLYRQLFQKELTPSDVGKLNRLVIPKKYVVKYFPQVSNGSPKKDEKEEEEGIVDVQLVFFDRQRKSWTFRYCYWKSSQSFVFTKGWNKFVKERGLKSKDVVMFYYCEHRNKDGIREQKKNWLIDVEYNTSENENKNHNDIVEEVNDQYPPQEAVDLELGLSYSSSDSDSRQEEEPEAKRPKLTQPLLEEKKGVWLLTFGKRIS